MMSSMSYEDYIEDSWLALAAAIVSPKELTVNESLRLIGLKPLGSNENKKGGEIVPKGKDHM